MTHGWIDREPFEPRHPAACGCQPCSRVGVAASRAAEIERLLAPMVDQLELDEDESAAVRRRLVWAYEKGRSSR